MGGEVALSVVLLVCTGLLIRSVDNLRRVDAGFSAERVLTQRVTAPTTRYPDRAAVHRAHDRIREEVERLPGVIRAATSNLFPFSGTNWEMRFQTSDGGTGDPPVSVLYTAASPGYFDVFSIRLVQGRLFTGEDRTDTEPVVVIDETAAQRFWPGEDPVGRTISVDAVQRGDEFVPRWRRIVGVVEHVRNYELTEPSRIEAYVPLVQSPCCSTLWLTVKTEGDPAELAPAVRDVVREFDPEMPVFRVSTMRTVLDGETAVHRSLQTLFVGFGLLALLLGVIGIWGVVASGAARRRREIGIRMALGSAPTRAAAAVATDGLRWVAGGLLSGLLLAVFAGRILESLLVGVTPLDPPTLAAVAFLLVLSAGIAAWLPARRSAGLAPARVLREE